MKPYVEKISTEVRYAEKSWGTYTVMDAEPGAMTVKVVLDAGSHMSYHTHENRDEVWTIVSGNGKVILDGKLMKVGPGEVVHIMKGVKHSVIAETNMSIIEVQIGNEITAEDKLEYEFVILDKKGK